MTALLPDRKTVGMRLKELRGSRTLEEVGADLKVTGMAVSQWERGERTPNDEMKVRIANYYKRSVNSIFFRL